MFRRFRKHEHIALDSLEIGVSGERHYGENIRELLCEHGGNGLEYRCTATIRREVDNPADEHAIEVVVHGRRVGYISKKSSASVAERIKKRSVELECVVSWNGEISNGIYHVKLFPVF